VPIPTDVRNAVVGAYYPRALSVPDTARARAQAAYSIAAAVAAAVVAAGVFGEISERNDLVQGLALAALVAWLAAAGLFLLAVSTSFYPTAPTSPNVEAFVKGALGSAATERRGIDRRLTQANWTTGVAALLTVLTITVAVRSPISKTQKAVVSLTPSGLAALRRVCPAAGKLVHATLAPDDLQKEFVTMTPLNRGVCAKLNLQGEIAVPRSQIASVAFTS